MTTIAARSAFFCHHPTHKLIHDAPLEARLRMIDLRGARQPCFSIECAPRIVRRYLSRRDSGLSAAERQWFISGATRAERILTWPYPDPAKALGELFAQAELLVVDREGAFVLPETSTVRDYAGQSSSTAASRI